MGDTVTLDAGGVTYRLKFKIKGLPPTVNTLTSWKVRWVHSKKWIGLVNLAVGRKYPEMPLKKARLVLTRYSTTEPDFDNLAGSFKYVVDGLVRAAVLEDDKPSIIGSPTFKWEKVKRGEGAIQVEVTGY